MLKGGLPRRRSPRRNFRVVSRYSWSGAAAWAAASRFRLGERLAARRRVEAKKGGQLSVQLGVARGERLRLFEELLDHHREELGRVGGAIRIDARLLAPLQRIDQRHILVAGDARPAGVTLEAVELRRTVHGAVSVVELVRELVQHH